MLTLQLLAGFFLCLSAALFFGPQLIAYGPRALLKMTNTTQVRFVGGGLVTLGALIVTGPYLFSAVVSGGETVFLMAIRFSGLSFA